jgi:hypothetical protein
LYQNFVGPTNAPVTPSPVTPSPTKTPVTPFPTKAVVTSSPTKTSAGYSLVGKGSCLDSSVGTYYDFARLDYQSQDANAAYNWCKTASAFASKLVGFEIHITLGDWYCLYDNGSIDNMPTTDFSPKANQVATANKGTGAIAFANNAPQYTCYRNEVRRINSSYIIIFLIFSHSHGSRPPSILLYCIRTL